MIALLMLEESQPSHLPRCLSKCVKSFLHFKTTLFTQDPQGFHKLVPMPTTTSLSSGEPRLASAARYLLSS